MRRRRDETNESSAPPAGLDVPQIAAELKLDLTDLDMLSFQTSLAKNLALLDEFLADNAGANSPAEVPGKGRISCPPSSAEDPLNAWLSRCSITGSGDGLLAGMTASFKDAIAVASLPLTCGIIGLDDYVPEFDATVVRRLLTHVPPRRGCDRGRPDHRVRHAGPEPRGLEPDRARDPQRDQQQAAEALTHLTEERGQDLTVPRAARLRQWPELLQLDDPDVQPPGQLTRASTHAELDRRAARDRRQPANTTPAAGADGKLIRGPPSWPATSPAAPRIGDPTLHVGHAFNCSPPTLDDGVKRKPALRCQRNVYAVAS